MNITLDQLFKTAYGVSVDDDGLDSDVRMHSFNVGYEMFLTEFDSIFPEMRLKTVKFISESGGNSKKGLGEDVGGNPYDDFFRPYDVHRTDAGESFYEEVFESTKRFSSDETWFTDNDKMYFLNYDEGEVFLVRYYPQFKHYPTDQNGATEVFLPMEARKAFYGFLVAMFNAVEQEPIQHEGRAMIFDQYFNDMEKMFPNKSISFSY